MWEQLEARNKYRHAIVRFASPEMVFGKNDVSHHMSANYLVTTSRGCQMTPRRTEYTGYD